MGGAGAMLILLVVNICCSGCSRLLGADVLGLFKALRRHAEGLFVVHVLEPCQIWASLCVHAADSTNVVDALVKSPNKASTLTDAHG